MDRFDMRIRRVCVGTAGLLLAAMVLTGCGFIADKDRIKIAKLGDDYYTRGDLYELLREMPDEERPHIQSKGDLIRVLQFMLDGKIKAPLASEIEQEIGKPLVTREQAKQRLFSLFPDENYQVLFMDADPRAFDMTKAEWESAKAEVELKIDKVEINLRGEAALAYRAIKAFQDGSLKIEDDEFKREYDLQKDTLKMPEAIHFLGIRFSTTEENAEGKAAEIRRRLDEGESFDDLVNEYLLKNKDYIVDSDIQQNPNSATFAGFWVSASGAEQGDIIGPVFMPGYQSQRVDEQGRVVRKVLPDAYVVLRVIEHAPERPLTLEEAKPRLAQGIMLAKMMKQLREENGMEIFVDKLPDPAMFGPRKGDPIRGE